MAKRFKAKDITVQEMTKDGLHNRNLETGKTERISRRIHREFDLERHSSDFLSGGKKRVLKLRRSGSSPHTKEKSGTQKTAENDRYDRDKWHSENSSSRKSRSRGQASSPHPFDVQKSSISSRGQTARPYTFDTQKSDANNRAQTSRPYTFDVQKSDVSSARKQYFKDSFKTIPKTIGNVGNDVAYKEMQKESEDNKRVSAALSGARVTVKGAKVVNKSSELIWKATVKAQKLYIQL